MLLRALLLWMGCDIVAINALQGERRDRTGLLGNTRFLSPVNSSEHPAVGLAEDDVPTK